MRLHVCAAGRLRSGPENELTGDYLTRMDRAGRGLGLRLGGIHEIEAKKGGMAEEARLLRRAVPAGAMLCVLDERGRQMRSEEFAAQIARWRDEGAQDAAFVIGGADGLDPSLRAEADMALSFGRMVWPHMLVRVMLAEQLYRAVSILSGAPYHRA